jgi:primosomal protein N' (replication factor Y)
MLHLPDFSASERTYQLLSQVSGRAGRGDRPGQVFIQTYTPTHPVILAASRGDYDAFAATELEQRDLLGYPPFTYLLKLSVSAPSSDTARLQSMAFSGQLRSRPHLVVAGPAPAFIELSGKKYHWIITVTAKIRPLLQDIAMDLPSVHWTADLDPINLL